MVIRLANDKDYIEIANMRWLYLDEDLMKNKNLPYVSGMTWTTDSIYREKEENLEKRKADGCISIEMECSAMQSVCDFRNVNLYFFFSSRDLLDSSECDSRIKDENDYTGTQHDSRVFDIAI